ncbi:hypothetical protein BDV97DRAFT_402300 [Delphinella strobiligena]|nr:hypothetical protein BDV97DRAFT_402300 [Delphinella strobiligena]
MIITPEYEEQKKRVLIEQKLNLEQVAKRNTGLTMAQKFALCHGNKELAFRLSDHMVWFLAEFRQSPQTDKDFQTYTMKNSVDVNQVWEATFLLRNLGSPEDAKFGRYLVRCCDVAGHEEATIQVVSSLLRQDITNREGILNTREGYMAQDRLREIGKKGNMRAIALEGKLAERKGDPDLAISKYQFAADELLARHESESSDSKEDNRYLDELSSPWMELGILHLRQEARMKALEAYMMGISMDDPMAHNMLGRLDYQFTGGEYTLDWLYNTTKAAATGHFRAAYSLGEYYATSKAPPPPSPQAETETEPKSEASTDSDDTTTKPTAPTFFARLQHFFSTSFIKPIIETDSRANIAHYAAAVQDPVARVKLAHEWLDVACEQHYLPAHLHMARLHLRKHVFPEDNLSRPLDEVIDGKENAVYSPEHAQKNLRTVFLAHRMIKDGRKHATTQAEFRAMAGRCADYPDVLQDYESNLDSMLDEAKDIADAVGMDVYDSEKSLLYRHEGLREQESAEEHDEVVEREK